MQYTELNRADSIVTSWDLPVPSTCTRATREGFLRRPWQRHENFPKYSVTFSIWACYSSCPQIYLPTLNVGECLLNNSLCLALVLVHSLLIQISVQTATPTQPGTRCPERCVDYFKIISCEIVCISLCWSMASSMLLVCTLSFEGVVAALDSYTSGRILPEIAVRRDTTRGGLSSSISVKHSSELFSAMISPSSSPSSLCSYSLILIAVSEQLISVVDWESFRFIYLFQETNMIFYISHWNIVAKTWKSC